MIPTPPALGALAALILLSACAATPEPETPPPQTPKPPASRVSSADRECLAKAIYFEARGTSSDGQAAVGHVVLNRARSAEFPSSVCAVISDGCQFSYRCDGRPDVLAHSGDRVRAYRIAERVLARDADITDGALFFHSARIPPGWFSTRPRVGQFGGNVFYR